MHSMGLAHQLCLKKTFVLQPEPKHGHTGSRRPVRRQLHSLELVTESGQLLAIRPA